MGSGVMGDQWRMNNAIWVLAPNGDDGVLGPSAPRAVVRVSRNGKGSVACLDYALDSAGTQGNVIQGPVPAGICGRRGASAAAVVPAAQEPGQGSAAYSGNVVERTGIGLTAMLVLVPHGDPGDRGANVTLRTTRTVVEAPKQELECVSMEIPAGVRAARTKIAT